MVSDLFANNRSQQKITLKPDLAKTKQWAVELVRKVMRVMWYILF